MSRAIRNIAFIGTGLMGAPMSRRLIDANFSVRVWNRTIEKTAPLVALGASVAPSPADAARGADVVCLCLMSAEAVSNVLFGAAGIAASATPDQLLVDFSTIGPAATLQMAESLQEQCGMTWVDAPVSGGVHGAAAGKLIVFCGGARSAVERLQSLFRALAQRVEHVGNLGAGQAAKLCNQLIVATNLIAIAEALSLAKAFGIDAAGLPEAFKAGFADSIPLQTFGRRMACGETEPKIGEIATMLKDIDLALGVSRRCGSPAPLAATAAEIYRFASAHGLQHEDLSALIRIYAQPNKNSSTT
jgi:3-hydroxyisobutyrate dehydrogenase